jgi:hypothetical protein
VLCITPIVHILTVTTGPGTDLDHRLNPDKTPKPFSMPVNRVDEAAYRHDLQYEKYADVEHRREADNAMIEELKKVRNDSNARWTERADAVVVEGAIRAKRFFGLGRKRRRRRVTTKKSV